MIKVNIAEVKAKLSEFLEMAGRGERVLICKHNRPVAELRAVHAVRTEPRPIGGAAGLFDVPPSFFDPLPDDLVGGFMGTTHELPFRAAEQPATYGATQPAGQKRSQEIVPKVRKTRQLKPRGRR
jgi:antitoxin (DNA-binding transcriptional repressor) of toxin-antitoxin stability system